MRKQVKSQFIQLGGIQCVVPPVPGERQGQPSGKLQKVSDEFEIEIAETYRAIPTFQSYDEGKAQWLNARLSKGQLPNRLAVALAA